jgi:hypothetical protein
LVAAIYAHIHVPDFVAAQPLKLAILQMRSSFT